MTVNYTSATATGASFAVTKASTSMTEAATPATHPVRHQLTPSRSPDLPVGATGTVTFTSGRYDAVRRDACRR